METHQQIALILFFVGLTDVILAPVIAKKQEDPRAKMIIMGAMFSGASLLVLLGVAFWFRWIG